MNALLGGSSIMLDMQDTQQLFAVDGNDDKGSLVFHPT